MTSDDLPDDYRDDDVGYVRSPAARVAGLARRPNSHEWLPSPPTASLISHRSPPIASLIRYGELLLESLARHGAFVAPRPRVKPEGVKPEGVKPEGAVVVRTAVSAAGGTLELLQVRWPLMASHRLSSPLIASDDL